MTSRTLITFASLFICLNAFIPAPASAETIAIIGTGNVAGALGPEFAAQGHTIVYGSRDPSTSDVKILVKETGNGASATSPAEARRNIYEQALASVADCDDVLLWNAEGFVTEASSSNVIAEIDGKLVTPPVTCGLLSGTYREWLLQQGEIKERAIHIDELAKIKDLTLINSVRGRIPARLSRN